MVLSGGWILVKCSAGQHGSLLNLFQIEVSSLLFSIAISHLLCSISCICPFESAPQKQTRTLTTLSPMSNWARHSWDTTPLMLLELATAIYTESTWKNSSARGYKVCISTAQSSKAFIMSNAREIMFGNSWQKNNFKSNLKVRLEKGFHLSKYPVGSQRPNSWENKIWW